MNALQLWMLAGALVMGGVACFVIWLVPAQPDLSDVMIRLAPSHPTKRQADKLGEPGLESRLGWWAQRSLPGQLQDSSLTGDLALLGKPSHVLLGERILLVGIAVVAVPLLSLLFMRTFNLPVFVPVVVTLVAAAAVWFLPARQAFEQAREARAEFRRALGAYIDLVALERNAGGSGTRQALENAAQIGDSWPFRRVAEELAHSRFAGIAPWDALHNLAAELNLPDLDELADIVRLSGEEGSQIYDTLRARSSALRNAMLTADQAQANRLGERMVFPQTLMAATFVAIIIAPAFMRLLAGG